MPLRRSLRRTPAFLSAHRANAQKSTGPRTALGKQRSAANLLRTRPGLRYAALPDHTDQRLSDAVSGLVWAMRGVAERDLRRLPRKARRLPGGWPMSPQISEIMFARPPVPVLGYCTQPTQRRTARTPQPDRRCQSRNAVQGPGDSAISSKRAEIAPPRFTSSEFFDYCISLIPGDLRDVLAYLAKSTVEKTRNNAPALTSTTESAPCLESTTFRLCVGGGERECSLKSVKRVFKANNVYKKSQTGMSIGISEMPLIREMWKCEITRARGTGMSFVIKDMSIRRRDSKGSYYSGVTGAPTMRKSDVRRQSGSTIDSSQLLELDRPGKPGNVMRALDDFLCFWRRRIHGHAPFPSPDPRPTASTWLIITACPRMEDPS